MLVHFRLELRWRRKIPLAVALLHIRHFLVYQLSSLLTFFFLLLAQKVFQGTA